MSSIPNDIYHDMFLRLPVKSIGICKCVCKTWFSIISHPNFSKEHLNLSAQGNNYSLMLYGDQVDTCSSISYDLLSSDDAVITNMFFPYKTRKENRIIIFFGSCNGLIYGWNNLKRRYFLWNPARKEYKQLPKQSTFDNSYGHHGFGYDYKTEDYKLVSMQYDGRVQRFIVDVYSLKSNSWKGFQSIRCGSPVYQWSSEVLFNGALHWLVSKASSKAIFSMDISEERFKELQLPATLPRDCCPNYTIKYDFSHIGVLDGYLCLLCNIQKTYEVWVMQDHKVTDSWTKLYTITLESIVFDYYHPLTLMGSIKNGEILFENPRNDSAIIYDPKYGTARKLNFRGLKELGGGAVSYFESLVSLNSIPTIERRENREITRHRKNSKTMKINRFQMRQDPTPTIVEPTSRSGADTSSAPARGRWSRGGTVATSSAPARGRGFRGVAAGGYASCTRSTTSTVTTGIRSRGAKGDAATRGRNATISPTSSAPRERFDINRIATTTPSLSAFSNTGGRGRGTRGGASRVAYGKGYTPTSATARGSRSSYLLVGEDVLSDVNVEAAAGRGSVRGRGARGYARGRTIYRRKAEIVEEPSTEVMHVEVPTPVCEP